jgi:hypothetical protein
MPTAEQVDSIRQFVGYQKVKLEGNHKLQTSNFKLQKNNAYGRSSPSPPEPLPEPELVVVIYTFAL